MDKSDKIDFIREQNVNRYENITDIKQENIMKKGKLILLTSLCLAVVFTMVSCGSPYSGVKFDDYIKLGKYKGIELKKQSNEVTDDDVDAAIKKELESKKVGKDVKTGVVKDGDSINIDYVGSIDGTKFSGGEEKGRTLVIGSNSFIKGFESGLIGAAVGSTRNIKVKFPDNYGKKELAGKNAVFAVKINSKKEYTVPKLTEEFVKNNSKQKTIADYKKAIKKRLEKEKKATAEETQRQQAWSKVVSGTSVKLDKNNKEKYPEKQLEKFVNETMKTYEDKANKENLSFKDFVKKNFGMDEKKFKEELTAYAKTQVKLDMIMYSIAEKEGIKVSSSEYDKFIDDTLEKYGYTKATFEKANNGKSYETIVGKEKIKAEALKKKVQNFIVSKAKITDE